MLRCLFCQRELKTELPAGTKEVPPELLRQGLQPLVGFHLECGRKQLGRNKMRETLQELVTAIREYAPNLEWGALDAGQSGYRGSWHRLDIAPQMAHLRLRQTLRKADRLLDPPAEEEAVPVFRAA